MDKKIRKLALNKKIITLLTDTRKSQCCKGQKNSKNISSFNFPFHNKVNMRSKNILYLETF